MCASLGKPSLNSASSASASLIRASTTPTPCTSPFWWLKTAFWARRESLHQSHLADLQASRIPEWHQTLSGLQHAGASAKQALGALNQQVVNQAYTVAALDIFWLFGVLSALMAPLIWLTRRSLAGGAPVSAD